MTPEAAVWVYDVVLAGPDWHGNGGDRPPHMVRHCRCQGGVCGWCWIGRHAECTTGTLGPVVGCETYLHPESGDGEPVAVWLSGKPCAWRCACTGPTPAAPVAPSASRIEQLDLFALLGGAR